MEEKLTSLYNTLLQIETKGESTLKMGVCLNYIERLIAELRAAKTVEAEPVETKKSSK